MDVCEACGHPVHRARQCPAGLYGERCACDEPRTPGKAPCGDIPGDGPACNWDPRCTTHFPPEFDGCNSECRRAGKHSMTWGLCAHAVKPEPTVSMSKVYRDIDGHNSIGFDAYTVAQLAELIEPALREVCIRLGPNALAQLQRGEQVTLSGGEINALALAAAHEIIHRNDTAQEA